MSIIRQTSVRHSEGITMTCENTSSNEVRMQKDTLANQSEDHQDNLYMEQPSVPLEKKA